MADTNIELEKLALERDKFELDKQKLVQEQKKIELDISKAQLDKVGKAFEIFKHLTQKHHDEVTEISGRYEDHTYKIKGRELEEEEKEIYNICVETILKTFKTA